MDGNSGGKDTQTVSVLFGCALFAVAMFVYVFYQPGEVESGEEKTRHMYLLERKEATYENLRDLSFEYKAGKLSEQDYAVQRASLEDEAAAILAEMDVDREIAGGDAAWTATQRCAGQGRPGVSDAQGFSVALKGHSFSLGEISKQQIPHGLKPARDDKNQQIPHGLKPARDDKNTTLARRPTGLLYLFTSLLYLLTSLLLFTSFAVAQNITGTVTNGTTGKPSAGDEVTLLSLSQGMQEVAHTKSDAHGRFSLPAPADQQRAAHGSRQRTKK